MICNMADAEIELHRLGRRVTALQAENVKLVTALETSNDLVGGYRLELASLDVAYNELKEIR